MLKIPARFKQCDLGVSLAFDYCDCIVNMGTRSAASVLRDVPNSPLELLKCPEMDSVRMGLYPSLDYKGLYNSLIPLIEVAPLIQNGLYAFGQAILQCLGCLLPFLEHDYIDNLPYLTASSIAVLPNTLHQDIVNTLCFYILPFTISRHNNREQEISQSLSAVIMMIFQYSSNAAHHCQLLECLMALKSSISKDILCVIAYGTSTARSSAAKLLFYYWPAFNPNLFDRKGLICRLGGDLVPFVCQRDSCPNAGNAEAAKVCYNHNIAITFASESPPPLYLCIECANEIHREHPNQSFADMLHPMQQVSMVCENKNCRSTDRSAISMCFSTECVSYNGNRPIRYCQQCHDNKHNSRRGFDHIFHKSIPPTWSMDKEMQTYMVEAIISLLKESKVQTPEPKETTVNGKISTPIIDNITIEERQLLGRYGVWLLVGRCTPDDGSSMEIMGRLLAMLFHWFHMTAYASNGQEESTLEKLKTENVCGWLKDISNSHYNLFISCLLPHPPEYARVGGHWDTLALRTSHLKDGLNRLFCLIPYEVITQEIWDYVMPHWMEAIVNDVPEKELSELKIPLSKILDHEMSPMSLTAWEMYHFVAIRFQNTTAKVQEQALHWLQTLSMLELIIPLSLLFTVFGDGVRIMKMGVPPIGEKGANKITTTKLLKPEEPRRSSISPVVEDCDSADTSLSEDEGRLSQHTEFETDAEHNLFCCILMLDIVLKQMELQDVDKHTGLNSSLCKDVCRLLKCMVTAIWIGDHVCVNKSECGYCEASVMWYQLCLKIVKYLSPEYPIYPPDPPLDENGDDVYSRKSPPGSDKKDTKSDVVVNLPLTDVHSAAGVFVHMPHVCSIMTATVETVSEQLDFSAIIPAEKVVSAVKAISLSDVDVARTSQLQKPPELPSEHEQVSDQGEDDVDDFWHTSVGRFKFAVEDLPQQLQYIYQLLKKLPDVDSPDILYYMLQCLNTLCLYGDACTRASKEHKGFFIWCQENLLIKNLWDLCNSEHSHISQEVIPLLLHCITLPSGSDVFWRVIQDDFHSDDWRVRFVAVERVTIIARFMDSTPLRNVPSLQAALANAFCYLISSTDDFNVYVAQRATLYLGTIHDRAIKSLIMCLETQFDTVIVDRPMVLQSLYQLHNLLSERTILHWEFFLNRFDTLFIEAQINLEKTGEVSYFRDLRNSDLNSECLIKKIHRAHEALSQSDTNGTGSVKTLSASFGTKWPYKRTMSAPASMLPRHETKDAKDKVYSRQYSAPVLKRKSSRFGLDGQTQSVNIVDDYNLMGFLHRVVEFEEADRETMHLLVFLLMQFLSRTDQAYPTDEKPMAISQAIVLRHLFLLLGYSQNERGVFITPQRLRDSPAFAAFVANLPQILDQNHLMGRVLIPTTLLLLQCVPAIGHLDYQQPCYSLWILESHYRRNWLMSLVVLLYKYQYTQQSHCIYLTSLIKIVINTLDAHHHRCRRLPATILMEAPPPRSRDVSQPSLGIENEPERLATPPLSPLCSLDGQSGHVTVTSKAGRIQVIYTKSCSSNMKTHWEEMVEPPEKRVERILRKSEEIAIEPDQSEIVELPETDLSDSTLQGSVQDSFEDVFEDSPLSPLREKGRVDDCHATIVQVHHHQIVCHGSKRPTWIIGSEEDSSKCSEGKKGKSAQSALPNAIAQNKHWLGTDYPKSFPQATSLGTSSLASSLAIIAGVPNIQTAMAKTVTTNSHRPVTSTSLDADHNSKPIPMDKAKTIPEPLLAVLSSPSEGCARFNSHQSDILLAEPSFERLLPIGAARNQIAKTTQALYEEFNFRSPESPLSKMDVMTIETDSPCDSVFSPTIESELTIPRQERLLPIGQHTKDVHQLVDKVRYALGMTSDLPKVVENRKNDDRPSLLKENCAQSHSPRRLMKQVALESPPSHFNFDKQYFMRDMNLHKDTLLNQRQMTRKTGIFVIGAHPAVDPRRLGSWCSPQFSPKPETSDMKQSALRVGEECVSERCSDCGIVKEEYSDEEIGLCIVTLGTFIHREPALAAPMLPDVLHIVSKIAHTAMYPWQTESNVHLPGGAVSVADQFLRCVLHQLAPNGIFVQMFQTHVNESARQQFFKNVIHSLTDFNELNPISPVQLLLETMNLKKHLSTTNLPIILQNIGCYMECLPPEMGLGSTPTLWVNFVAQLESFYRKLTLILGSLDDLTPLFKIMIAVLKIPVMCQFKGFLEPFSKVICHTIQRSVVKYNYFSELCCLCNRLFVKERDKLILSRIIVYELIQALKFKSTISDSNLITLISMVLYDAGGSIPPNVVIREQFLTFNDHMHIYSTALAECMRFHLGDLVEFLSDFHTLAKIKSYTKGMPIGLNEDTIGGIIKGGIAQYLALEITKGNGRDNKAVARYFPWLYNVSAVQQTPREFIECIGHIRLLSWLLLGSLTHIALHGNSSHTYCQPIAQETSCQIADNILVVMAGFAEQPKASVLHMSSLFHTFIMCQLWTVYLEQGLCNNLPTTEAYNVTMNILFEFWDKVTPCILQLVQQSKMLSEIVSLHFLSMLEALLECNSTFVAKLLPLWTPVLCSNHIHLPGHLQVRLQNCRNFPPNAQFETLLGKAEVPLSDPMLLKWLQRLQFKMGQIELQSSTATQFYSL